MRRPIQVLVLPYIYKNNTIYYALFKRSDLGVWQGIAGGVESGETISTACKREAYEEANIPATSKYIKLNSKSTIPVNFIDGDFKWGPNVYNAVEYCYGVCVNNTKISISEEHIEYVFVTYEEGFRMLKWDSNRNALWELNERLKRELNCN